MGASSAPIDNLGSAANTTTSSTATESRRLPACRKNAPPAEYRCLACSLDDAGAVDAICHDLGIPRRASHLGELRFRGDALECSAVSYEAWIDADLTVYFSDDASERATAIGDFS
jgi:hypothetical protein